LLTRSQNGQARLFGTRSLFGSGLIILAKAAILVYAWSQIARLGACRAPANQRELGFETGRVVAAIEGGMSRRQAAAHFGGFALASIITIIDGWYSTSWQET